jgi:hypothetical protein
MATAHRGDESARPFGVEDDGKLESEFSGITGPRKQQLGLVDCNGDEPKISELVKVSALYHSFQKFARAYIQLILAAAKI